MGKKIFPRLIALPFPYMMPSVDYVQRIFPVKCSWGT